VAVEKLLETAEADIIDVLSKIDVIIKIKARVVNPFFNRSSCIVTYLCFHKYTVVFVKTADIRMNSYARDKIPPSLDTDNNNMSCSYLVDLLISLV
jgi:hypothetical protein